MVTKELKEKRGITLVALVLTIIILLILAGVALNLVVGENGIVGRAVKAGKTYDIAGAKEQFESLVASYVAEYFQGKYTAGEGVDDIRNYVITKLEQESKVGDYELEKDGIIIVLKKDDKLASGKVNEDGSITWHQVPFDPSTIELGTEANAVDSDKYGYKVTNYKSKYEEDNNIELGWRLFYKDSNFSYIISDTLVGNYKPSDYYTGQDKYANGSKVSLIGQKLNPLISSLFVDSNENSNIKSTAWMTDTEYWDEYTDTNGKAIYAIASPTIELYKNSFNATANINNATIITIGTGSYGYTVNTEIQQLKKDYTRGIYNKNGINNCWMASPHYRYSSYNWIVSRKKWMLLWFQCTQRFFSCSSNCLFPCFD